MTAQVPLRPRRGGVNGVHEPFTPRLQAANTRAEATSQTNHVVDGLGHPASIVEKTSAQVDGYQLAFTAGAFLMLAAGIVVLGLLRRADVATIDAEEAIATV
jgi:hypothetical protein